MARGSLPTSPGILCPRQLVEGVPEGAAEEAGNEESRQARNPSQEVHHKIEDKLQAEQSTALFRGGSRCGLSIPTQSRDLPNMQRKWALWKE